MGDGGCVPIIMDLGHCGSANTQYVHSYIYPNVWYLQRQDNYLYFIQDMPIINDMVHSYEST